MVFLFLTNLPGLYRSIVGSCSRNRFCCAHFTWLSHLPGVLCNEYTSPRNASLKAVQFVSPGSVAVTGSRSLGLPARFGEKTQFGCMASSSSDLLRKRPTEYDLGSSCGLDSLSKSVVCRCTIKRVLNCVCLSSGLSAHRQRERGSEGVSKVSNHTFRLYPGAGRCSDVAHVTHPGSSGLTPPWVVPMHRRSERC